MYLLKIVMALPDEKQSTIKHEWEADETVVKAENYSQKDSYKASELRSKGCFGDGNMYQQRYSELLFEEYI